MKNFPFSGRYSVQKEANPVESPAGRLPEELILLMSPAENPPPWFRSEKLKPALYWVYQRAHIRWAGGKLLYIDTWLLTPAAGMNWIALLAESPDGPGVVKSVIPEKVELPHVDRQPELSKSSHNTAPAGGFAHSLRATGPAAVAPVATRATMMTTPHGAKRETKNFRLNMESSR